MSAPQPNFRVIVRLPYNRPEDPRPNPPRVEWNPEKEHILWEVIAKSRVVEGAGTDWKGLAGHLQVPLPYLLYRAQARYEEDLRGLQGVQTSLSGQSATSPTSQGGPSQGLMSTSPLANQLRLPTEDVSYTGTPEMLTFPRKDPASLGGGSSSSIARPLPIRTRLNSLSARSMNSPHRVTSSSMITLQGPRRHTSHLRLSPTASRSSSADESSEEDDEQRKLEEEEKQAEEQAALEQKLKDLTLKLTKDQIGLVSSPLKNKGKGKETDRGRIRPLSASAVSGSLHQLEMSRRNSVSQTPSHHSLSSTSSPQGSIPSIPSPPPEARSQPQSPMARHLSPGGKSNSPPALALNNAWATRNPMFGRARTSGKVRSDIGSEMGSTTSSFSDFSDASLSGLDTEAFDSRVGSRVSSYARSNYAGRRQPR